MCTADEQFAARTAASQQAYMAEQEREAQCGQDQMLDSGIDIPSSVQATDMASSPPLYPAVTSSPGLVSDGLAGYRAGLADSSPSPVLSSDELMP